MQITEEIVTASLESARTLRDKQAGAAEILAEILKILRQPDPEPEPDASENATLLFGPELGRMNREWHQDSIPCTVETPNDENTL